MKMKSVLIFLLYLLALGGPAVAVILSGEALFGVDLSIAHLITTYLLFMSGFFLSIILHEVGHMVGGLISGHRFLMIRLFSFALSREEDGLRFRRYGFPGSLGQCLMVPRREDSRSFLPYFLGGGVFNLVTGLLGLWAMAYIPHALGINLYLLLGFHAVFALGVGAMNLIPTTAAGIPNDGRYVRLMLEDRRRVEAFHETQHLTWQLFRGVRPRDMAWSGLSRWDGLEASDIFRISAVAFEVLCLADSGEPEKAMERIAAIRDGMEGAPEAYRLDILQSELFFEVYHRKDRERARALFPVLEQHLRLKKNTDAYLALGAYQLYIEEDREAAVDFLKKAMAAAKTSPLRGAAQMEMEYIERFLEEALGGKDGGTDTAD